MTYSVTEFYDETTRVRRDDWTDVSREPEYVAFQIILHDVHSSIGWQVIEARQSREKQAWEAERARLLHLYSTWRYYVSRFRGMSDKSYIEAAARKCSVAANEVRRALVLVDAHGLAGMMQ